MPISKYIRSVLNLISNNLIIYINLCKRLRGDDPDNLEALPINKQIVNLAWL